MHRTKVVVGCLQIVAGSLLLMSILATRILADEIYVPVPANNKCCWEGGYDDEIEITPGGGTCTPNGNNCVSSQTSPCVPGLYKETYTNASCEEAATKTCRLNTMTTHLNDMEYRCGWKTVNPNTDCGCRLVTKTAREVPVYICSSDSNGC